MNELITLLVGLVIGAGLFALGIRYFPVLAREKQGYPLEEEIEALLLPHIFHAISSAYRVSEKAVDELRMRLRGADKANIAKEVYDLLPDKIGGFDVSLIKDLISEEKFAGLIQTAFENFDEFFVEHQTRFDELYETWKEENAPDSG